MGPVKLTPYQRLAEGVAIRMFGEIGIKVTEHAINPQVDLFNPRKSVRCHRIGTPRGKNALVMFSHRGAVKDEVCSVLLDLPKRMPPRILLMQWRRPSGESGYPKTHFNMIRNPYKKMDEAEKDGFRYTYPLSDDFLLPEGHQEKYERIFLEECRELNKTIPLDEGD